MKIFAPAKVNLMLHVTGRRPDGYHTLQSLMARADLADELDVTGAKGFSLSVTGPFAGHAPADESNLVSRAVRLMEQRAGRSADLAIRLTKNLPAGAGLGGGSADAATAMYVLNDRWGHPFALEDLQAMGLLLGAELPLCLAGGAQWVEGIGEIMSPVTMPSFDSVIIWPGAALATADVFRAFKGPFSPVMSGPDDIAACRNDLTDAAISLQPVIRTALEALKGARFARMSGSGSAVFGIYESEDAAKETAARVAAAFPDWWVRHSKIN